MKAKDGVRISLDFALFWTRRVSWSGLFGPGGDRDRAAPIQAAVVPVAPRTARMTRVCSIAFLVFVAGFYVPAFAGLTLDLTTTASSGYADLAYFIPVDPQATAADVIEPFVGLSIDQNVSQGYANADNGLRLNSSLGCGSGSTNMLASIPESFFNESDGSYVHLCSKFGEHHLNNAGFKEWAVRIDELLPKVPVPGAVVLAGIGACFVGWLRRRKTL